MHLSLSSPTCPSHHLSLSSLSVITHLCLSSLPVLTHLSLSSLPVLTHLSLSSLPVPLTTCPHHYVSLSPPAPLIITGPHALSLSSSVLTTCTTNCPSHHRSSPVLDHLSTPVAAICSHLAYVIRRPLYLSLLSVLISPSSVYPYRTPSVTHSLLFFYHLFPPSLHNLSPPSVLTCPHLLHHLFPPRSASAHHHNPSPIFVLLTLT
ncbi:hypothetical protein Pcinc_022226 [Petrolisthes cinctipes]|uniref:Uncharacterized protein n=1 Tax=Petrolisthes cinctipes TaxID=88211 RepID=A0AAE1KIN2_PETCI|nr:hypothetical protein Pcinc_022226 [Petrolisthes cinctipes]